MNTQLTADEGWSSSLGLGVGLQLLAIKMLVTKCYTGPRTLADSLERRKPNMFIICKAAKWLHLAFGLVAIFVLMKLKRAEIIHGKKYKDCRPP
jgi:hypothetical protein